MKKSVFYLTVFFGLLLSVLFQNCRFGDTPPRNIGINNFGYEFIEENDQNYIYLHAYDDFGTSYDIDLERATISWDTEGAGAPIIPYQLTREEANELQNLLDEAVYCRALGQAPVSHYNYKYTFTFINDDVLEDEPFDSINTLCSYGIDSLEVSRIFGYMHTLYERYRNLPRIAPEALPDPIIPIVDDPVM